MLAKRSKPGGGTSKAKPLGMSAVPLSEAELAQLDKRVQGWKKFKVGREVVKKVGKDTVRYKLSAAAGADSHRPKARHALQHAALYVCNPALGQQQLQRRLDGCMHMQDLLCIACTQS